MRILGIDPGTNIIGWGIIEKTQNRDLQALSYDSIIIKKGATLSEKLTIIYDKLSELITLYKPEVAAVEELFFVKNITTGISVGQARGVILLALKQNNVNLFEYKPREIKQAVTGYGNAEKPQVQVMVTKLLKLKEIPKPDDTADALAVAICHDFKSKLNKFINLQN